MLPPEWVQAARSGQALPDLRLLRSELEQAKEQSVHLEAQLAERGQLVQALQGQLDAVAAAKSQTEAELASLEEQMNALSVELQQVVAGDETAAPAADDETAATETQGDLNPPALEVTRRQTRRTGGCRCCRCGRKPTQACRARSRSTRRPPTCRAWLMALTSDKQALEALLTDMQAQLDAATAELNDTDQQLGGLRSDLQASLGEGVPVPEPAAPAETAPTEAVAPAEAVAAAEAGGQEAPSRENLKPRRAETEAAAPAEACPQLLPTCRVLRSMLSHRPHQLRSPRRDPRLRPKQKLPPNKLTRHRCAELPRESHWRPRSVLRLRAIATNKRRSSNRKSSLPISRCNSMPLRPPRPKMRRS